MDNALVNISEQFCTTYVCNHTDKTAGLSKDGTFCSGIVITNPLITIDEHTFTSAIDIDRGMIARKLNSLGFQEHGDQLLETLLKFRNAVAIKGDTLGHTEVLQHEIILEDGGRPFFIPI